MRCEEVIQELAAPVDGQDRAALAEHLGNCPACAEWSARMASFDHLWGLTRPEDPSPEQWDAVWARLERAIGSVETPIAAQTLHSPLRIAPESMAAQGAPVRPAVEVQRGIAPDPFPFETWLRARSTRQRLLVKAAAAVFLVGLGAALFMMPDAASRRPPGPVQVTLQGGPIEPMVDTPVSDSVEIEEGELVVIRMAEVPADEAEMEIVRYEPEDAIDWFVMFNNIESMLKPIVAGR